MKNNKRIIGWICIIPGILVLIAIVAAIILAGMQDPNVALAILIIVGFLIAAVLTFRGIILLEDDNI